MRLRFASCLAYTSCLILTGLASPFSADAEDADSACAADAFRLCAAEIPDVPRITACMERNKRALSPACARFFLDDVARTRPTKKSRKRNRHA